MATSMAARVKDSLFSTIAVLNLCTELLTDENRPRELQQQTLELKLAAANFEHELLKFLGKEGRKEKIEENYLKILKKAYK